MEGQDHGGGYGSGGQS
uniref:Uncharacterized protein n=1 Tax=Rhizophora mucronata TaxID=61149 RepID=A0A2P2KZC7_RHIMU